MSPDDAIPPASAGAPSHAQVVTGRVVTACSPERRRRFYRAAAVRLQQFAEAHPEVRHDLETLEIDHAMENLNEALALFMEDKCKRERVSAAFEAYEQALINATAEILSTE